MSEIMSNEQRDDLTVTQADRRAALARYVYATGSPVGFDDVEVPS